MSTVELDRDVTAQQNVATAEGCSVSHARDYPLPQSMINREEFVWDEALPPVENYVAFGKRLSQCPDLYRAPAYAAGLILALPTHNGQTQIIKTGKQLGPVIADRVRISVVRDGNVVGATISTSNLNTMLSCEAFLQQLRPVDRITQTPVYLPDFTLTQPGYNDGGVGNRILYVGCEPQIEYTPTAINAFLNVMAFATPADRTNTVAAALTVQLRNHFIGAKPMIAVTASKSQAGKDTDIQFATGNTRSTSISYQTTDWALERAAVGALKHDPDAGVLIVDNARVGNGTGVIASAFLERFITDPEPLLFSTGSGSAVRRQNDIVVAISTNFGTISEDLMNRALPIHLQPVGNVAERVSSIGNPKIHFLPANRDRIEAELRGMIQRWIDAEMPRDTAARHPFTEWASVVGGILMVSGYTDFLGNYAQRRTADDPVRHALGLLGGAKPDQWQPAADWAKLAVDLGIVRQVIPEAERSTEISRARGIGKVLSAHRDETFVTETDTETLTLKLTKMRRRFEGVEPSTRYSFVVVNREPLPLDDESLDENPSNQP